MAFHRLVVVASLPATFPTLGRVRPNMTEQAALTRVNRGQQTLTCHDGSPLSGLLGGLAKAKQVLDLTRNKNAEDLLPQRHAGNHVAASVVTVCTGSDQLQYAVIGAPEECGARAQARPSCLFHVDTTYIFPRDKTGLTMGKPEVNPTFSQIYTRDSLGTPRGGTNKYPPYHPLVPPAQISVLTLVPPNPRVLKTGTKNRY